VNDIPMTGSLKNGTFLFHRRSPEKEPGIGQDPKEEEATTEALSRTEFDPRKIARALP
jgi:hypothetical protein